ncbi:MAG: PHP domain-containing protein [Ruminococcaceae bacterium]|nr:PHP domain-containing protein [Oscillospiraceae bacterium]
MGYLYDLHCHNKEGSVCSRLPAKDMVDFYIKQGYNGFVVTNHFTGSTTVPDEFSWEERVDCYFEAYEECLKYAENKIKVFFGIEYSILKFGTHDMHKIMGNDFVILGLTREWLKANRDAFDKSTNELFDEVHKAGGFIIHAHPFLEEGWISHIQLFPQKEDAVEIMNMGVDEETNKKALWYAQTYNKIMTGGTDIHFTDIPYVSGVECENECNTIEDLISEIKSGTTKVIHKAVII